MPFIGEVRVFPYNFAPVSIGTWVECGGQELSTKVYAPLFTVIGTRYGGDGKSTFKVPKIRGVVVAGAGKGAGLTERALGETWGVNEVVLTADNMPAHGHQLHAAWTKTVAHLSNTPAVSYGVSRTISQSNHVTTLLDKLVKMHKAVLSPFGGGGSHENRQPVLAIGYFICIEDGDFPMKPD